MACFVNNCKNKVTKNKNKNSFFRFPKDEHLIGQWLKFCRKENATNVKNALICNEHFRTEDIRGQLQFEMGLCKSRSLMSGAVPCIYNNNASLAKQERIQKKKNKQIVEELLKQANAEEEAIMALVSEAEANPVIAQPEELYLETHIRSENSSDRLQDSKTTDNNAEEESVMNLSKCRTCYQYYMADQKAKDLYDEQNCDILDDIKLIAGVSIKIQVGLPQHICSSCLADLCRAVHFREACIKTEKKLRQFEKQPKLLTDPFNADSKDELAIDNDGLASCNISETVNNVMEIASIAESAEIVLYSEITNEVNAKIAINSELNIAELDFMSTQNDSDEDVLLKLVRECNIENNETIDKAPIGEGENGKSARNSMQRRKKRPKLSVMEKQIKRIERRKQAPRNFICDKCGFAFKNSHSLRAHLARHDGIKKYQCPECPKRFYTNSDANTHVQIVHRGQKLFNCRHCDESFSYSTTRYLHEKNVHSINPVQKKSVRYACNLCERSYVRRNDLREHMNMHTGEKPFKCRICGKAFERHKVATKHEKIHNPKTFNCAICSEIFPTRVSFNSHMRIHTEPLPYKCEFCDIAYQHSYQLSAHKRTKIHLENEQILNACFEIDSGYLNA